MCFVRALTHETGDVWMVQADPGVVDSVSTHGREYVEDSVLCDEVGPESTCPGMLGSPVDHRWMIGALGPVAVFQVEQAICGQRPRATTRGDNRIRKLANAMKRRDKGLEAHLQCLLAGKRLSIRRTSQFASLFDAAGEDGQVAEGTRIPGSPFRRLRPASMDAVGREIVMTYLKVAASAGISVAERVPSLSVDDAIQAASLHLWTLVHTREPESLWGQHVRAQDFYQVLRARLLRDALEHSGPVRVPIHRVETFRSMLEQLDPYVGPVAREIRDWAARNGQDQKALLSAFCALAHPVPIGPSVEDDDNPAVLIEDRSAIDPVDAASLGALRDLLGELLVRLPDRERRVIELRFGLLDGHSRTLEEVGREFGLSRERIRQVESSAMSKLRSPGWLDALRDYL